MKNLLFAILVLSASVVNAAQVTILDTMVTLRGTGMTSVETRFQVNQNTGEGFVKVLVFEENYYYQGGGNYDQYGRSFPYPMPHQMPFPVIIFEENVKVEGLMLMGDKVMYHGAEGDVDCGTLGVSRVFKRPTIYLNGNCKLSGSVMNRNGKGNVVVLLKTK